MLHPPIEMGSAALSAPVPYLSKATRISRKGQKSNIMVNSTKLLKKIKILRFFFNPHFACARTSYMI